MTEKINHKDNPEVAPCPFCGGGVKAKSMGFGVAGLVVCEDCKTMFLLPWDEADTDLNLVHSWNRRAKR
jgi:hypothetical protein